MEWDDGGETGDMYLSLMDLLDEGRPQELVWKQSNPFRTYAEYAQIPAVTSEYRQVFDDAVGEVTDSYGPPRFLGERSRPGFPNWSEASFLALWAGEDELCCYVALCQPSRDDPVQIRIGVR